MLANEKDRGGTSVVSAAAFADSPAASWPEAEPLQHDLQNARLNVTPRIFGREIKRNGWPSRWIVGCYPASYMLLGKKATTYFSGFIVIL